MPKIQWLYESDRYVPDFHILIQSSVMIYLENDSVNESSTYIRQNSVIIFENNSVSPISIYSGTTSADIFALDPDLTLYGNEFKSPVLQPGERWSIKFVTVGNYNYFVYPSILIGSIFVTRNRISGRDQFIILESDNLESPFSSRIIKVDNYGNILFSFGDCYLVKPRDARSLLNNNILIST
jgi:hypothetical protein